MNRTPRKQLLRRWVAVGTVAAMALSLGACTTTNRPSAASAEATPTSTITDPTETDAIGAHTSTAASSATAAAALGGANGVAGAAAMSTNASQRRSTFTCSQFEPKATLGVRSGSAEESLSDALFKKLLASSLEYGTGEGVGWVLSLMTGEKGDKSDLQNIQQQISQANTSIDGLKSQITQLHQDLQDAYHQLSLDTTKGTLQTSIADIGTIIADLDNIQIGFDGVVSEAKTQSPNYVLNTSKNNTDLLADFRRRITLDIDKLLRHLNSDQPGAQTPIELYDSILWQQIPAVTAKTDKRIMPGTYLNAAYDQVDYYTAVLVKAADLLSEVYHVSWKGYPSNPRIVQIYVACAQALAQELSLDAAHGVGRVPVDTVVDDRNTDAPRLWTNSAVSLDGDPRHTEMVNGDPTVATSDQAYCTAASRYCLVHQYDQQGDVATTTAARPTPGALTSLIAAQRPLGYADWRIPTLADWNTLQSGATGGLSAWAAPQSLNQFIPATITSYHAGQNTKLTVIPATWVNTDATATAPRYELLTSADPTANSLTVRPAPSNTVNATGGRLYLVRNLPASDQPIVIPTSRQHLPTAAKKPAGVPATITLSTPIACSAAAAAYHVPAGVYSVQVTATGGAGAPGLENNKPTAKGGAPAATTATIPVTPGSTLYYQVGAAADGSTGGVGGGGNGGSSTGSGQQSGGGGGATGLSSTPDCRNWLIVAGGGGGGGGGVTQNATAAHYNGGPGGNASTTPGTPTTGSDGKDNFDDAGSRGHGSPGTDGGGAGKVQISNKTIYAAAGGNGNDSTAGNGGNASTDHWGGGGGGGGGGYNSGGGGGGGLYATGGGGGGGASFAMTALGVTPTYTNAAGTQSSLTITPTGSDITIQSATTGWTMNIPGGQSTDGTALIQYPRENSANSKWQFRPVDAATGGGQLINPATGKCATVTNYGTVALATCSNPGVSTQEWVISDNPDATVTLTSAADPAGRVLTATTTGPVNLIVYPDNTRPGQHWTLTSADWPND